MQMRTKLSIVTSFPLPPHYGADISPANELFVLHEDKETVSLYRPDAAAGFRLQWTRPAPAAPTGQKWWWMRAAFDGHALFHALSTETVLLDAEGREAGRWEVHGLILLAASSRHAVYTDGVWNNHQLHVHDGLDHSRRLFSLRSEDGGRWGRALVSVSPTGTFFVADNERHLLAAFSSTGERLFQRSTAYTPLLSHRPVCSDTQHVFVADNNVRNVIYVHSAASGEHVTTLTAKRLQLESEEVIAIVRAGLGQTLLVYVYKGDDRRIITHAHFVI